MNEVKHAIQRTVSVISVLAVMSLISLIGYMGYVTLWKPHHNPTRTEEQIAEHITNITEVKEEEAVELSIIPPKIKLGGFKFKLFDF
jgi:hypothetical protein